MMVIGLTGGIACGKNTVATMLSSANIPIIDADIISRETTKKSSRALAKIVEVFGSDVLKDDGSLDRKKLGAIVFHDEALRKKLEDIVHPEIEKIKNEHLARLREQNVPVAVYMAPLIFETDLHRTLDKTILVVAHRDIAMARAMKRDNLSALEIKKRMDAQMNEKEKAERADVVIYNNGSINELYEQVSAAWEKLTGAKLTKKLN